MTSVFNNLRLQGHGGMGSLTIGDEVRWAPKGGKAATVAASDVARATWSVFGKYAALTLYSLRRPALFLRRISNIRIRGDRGPLPFPPPLPPPRADPRDRV